MAPITTLLWLGALPAAGNIVGAAAGELIRITQRRLSIALHGSAGVLLAVVALELLPEAMRQVPPWLVIISFVVGGAAFIGLDHAMENIRARAGKEVRGSGPWTIYTSVGIDLISDGMMIGIALALSFQFALLLALGQAIANAPQGLAMMGLLQQRASRWTRLMLVLLLAIPLYAGEMLGYFVLRGGSKVAQFAILGFTAGLLASLAVEEIVPQAHERGDSHTAAAVFVLAFAGFVALSAYL